MHVAPIQSHATTLSTLVKSKVQAAGDVSQSWTVLFLKINQFNKIKKKRGKKNMRWKGLFIDFGLSVGENQNITNSQYT